MFDDGNEAMYMMWCLRIYYVLQKICAVSLKLTIILKSRTAQTAKSKPKTL